LTGFGAPVTYVSRVSPAEKRATPSKASLLLLLGGNAPDAPAKSPFPVLSCAFPGIPFTCSQLTSVITEQHCVRENGQPTGVHVHLHLR
jgi:hypothetical protein